MAAQQQQHSAIDRIVRETLGNQLATIISLQAQLEDTVGVVNALQTRLGELEAELQDTDNQDAKTKE